VGEPITMTPTALLEAIQELSKKGDNDAVVALADANLAEIQSRPACAEDAESCRLTMLAQIKRGGSSGSDTVWRVRSLARATAIGWQECIMALAIPDVFGLIEAIGTPSDPPSFDEFRVPREALEVLEELRPFAGNEPGPYSFGPEPPFFARLYHEKRGFLLCAMGEYAAAIASYDEALDAAETNMSERGKLKVRAGRALCTYLWNGSDNDVRAAIDETATIAEHPTQLEIAAIAKHNLGGMRARTRDVTPYETLGF
jgi:hypothetical protein